MKPDVVDWDNPNERLRRMSDADRERFERVWGYVESKRLTTTEPRMIVVCNPQPKGWSL